MLAFSRVPSILVGLFLGLCLISSTQGQEIGSGEFPGGLTAVAEANGVRVVATVARFEVRAACGAMIGSRPADKAHVAEMGRLVAAEIGLYPPNLVARARIRRVVLCDGLTMNRMDAAGLTDSVRRQIYLDVKTGVADKAYARRTFHHELFHVIEPSDRDERWISLNRTGFVYAGSSRGDKSLAGFANLSDQFPGFLNQYSMMSVAEDKAEVFSHLMGEPTLMERRVKTDPILRAKVGRMKAQLVEYCPDANAEFWAKVRTAKQVR